MSEEKLTRAAVVTGGSRGIGRAVCVALAKQGCNVVVNYCHGVDAAAETVAQCTTLGVQAVAVQADVAPGAVEVAAVGVRVLLVVRHDREHRHGGR